MSDERPIMPADLKNRFARAANMAAVEATAKCKGTLVEKAAAGLQAWREARGREWERGENGCLPQWRRRPLGPRHGDGGRSPFVFARRSL
jgi:hypothetical protein